MDVLVIDATHGGVKLAIEFSKLENYNNIYLYDIYNTLNTEDNEKLKIKNIKTTTLKDFKSKDLLVVSPVHLPLREDELKSNINAENYRFITHHEAVKILLDEFFKNFEKIPIVEITGVKGKTSSVFILKEILKDLHPLILSSLGIIQVRDSYDINLKKDISITPANIKQAVDLAFRIDNPICDMECNKSETTNNINYKSMILESSLGVTGIGDVGLLTNIVENYPIAKNKSDAKTAKSQIFKCSKIAIDKKTLEKYYKKELNEFKSKIITFSIDDKESNVIVENVEYSFDCTKFKVIFKNVKTITDRIISGEFKAKSFAPAPHHMENILGAITVALILEIPENKIINGLASYKGIVGRTHVKNIDGLKVIDEVNPGINTKTIEYSINMLKNPEKYSIIIGGDYGVTCEEINEEKVAKLLDGKTNLNLILTGAVGENINKKLNNPIIFIKDYEDAIDKSLENNLNILFIYRSDYHKLSLR